MTKVRSIKKIFLGEKVIEGAGVSIRRIFGHKDVTNLDPFLLLDFFNSKDPKDYVKGFPWHPHRGIETVTYLIEGEIEHEDSLGNTGVIKSGDCQWMTAGNGIIHQEMPKESPNMLGIQLWINLSSNNKMIEPKYEDINSKNIPKVEEDDGTIRVIAGEYKNTSGPGKGTSLEPIFIDVNIKRNGKFIYETEPNSTVFALIVQGEGNFDRESKKAYSVGTGILYNLGEKIEVNANEKGVRFLLLSGKPIKEPIAWGGPVVMNTKEELRTAFKQIDDGTFIKKV